MCRERMRPLAERQRRDTVERRMDRRLSFLGDERRLHQALVNLVTNAINHTPPGRERDD